MTGLKQNNRWVMIMKVIGITGGVGCGKSSVLTAIKELYNCVILYADDAAKKIEEPGNKCYEDIVKLLGHEILNEDGTINSRKMAASIFEDEALLKSVNDIIHPAVKEYILNQIKKSRESGMIDYFFLEAALLIECGYKSIVDEMWYVYADETVRRTRLKESRGYDDKKIDSIMNSQLSEEEFRNNCDFIIDNSKSLEESIIQIKQRIEK